MSNNESSDWIVEANETIARLKVIVEDDKNSPQHKLVTRKVIFNIFELINEYKSEIKIIKTTAEMKKYERKLNVIDVVIRPL